jgi:hypothetical protein
MTVRLEAETIFLESECPVEDSATLAQHLSLYPQATVDWSECDSMHTAVFQVLLAVRPPLLGTPAGAFVGTHLARLLGPRDHEPAPRLPGR